MQISSYDKQSQTRTKYAVFKTFEIMNVEILFTLFLLLLRQGLENRTLKVLAF